jgi:hypothetical protein
MQGVQLVKPVYFDPALLATVDRAGQLFDDVALAPPVPLYRFTAGGDVPRIYFKKSPVRTFASVTSIISATTPTSPFLTKWVGQMGLRQAEQYRDARAAFGTLLHTVFGVFLVERKFDLATVQSVVDLYVQEENLTCDVGTWSDELKSALVGLADFVRDVNLRPVGIELPFASDALGWAGSIDLVALVDLKRRKDVLALIDFKSGDFHEAAEVQVGAYRMLFNEAYPMSPITDLFLFGPKSFDEGSNVRYRLKNITESPLKGLMPNLLEQFLVRNPKRDPVLEISDATISLDADHDGLVNYSPIEKIIERLDQ